MFDLTNEIKLDQKMQKRYNIARGFLYAAFFIVVLFIADRVIFPSVSLIFSFDNANSLKNTINPPYVASAPENPAKNPISTKDKFIFYSTAFGNFSDVLLTFTTKDNSADIKDSSVYLRKSYQAFLYPIGEPVGFKDGTLLTTENGKYYLVSDGVLRKFESIEILLSLGYPRESFLKVQQSDLQYNKPGADIIDKNGYPDDTLFAVEDTYYKLKEGQLFPFISAQAFLSQFEVNQAIIKDRDFLSRYALSEKLLGFADGTLVSYDISVYILSEDKSYPINSANTFVRMGFEWKDVVPIDSEELSLYEKQKIFTLNQVHPDGTIFFDESAQKYFIIKDKHKLPIGTQTIAKSYSKKNPIKANLQENENDAIHCQLKKSQLNSHKYFCEMPLDSVANFFGNDYEVNTRFANEAEIKNINTTFSTPANWKNLMLSLSTIKNNIKNNYITPPQ